VNRLLEGEGESLQFEKDSSWTDTCWLRLRIRKDSAPAITTATRHQKCRVTVGVYFLTDKNLKYSLSTILARFCAFILNLPKQLAFEWPGHEFWRQLHVLVSGFRCTALASEFHFLGMYKIREEHISAIRQMTMRKFLLLNVLNLLKQINAHYYSHTHVTYGI
jgi:hypothetical protein